MLAIEQHPYVRQVLEPLPDAAGAGECLDEDPVLEFLEGEIRKVGSLAHTDVDWVRVEKESLAILSRRSKDLRVLGFLMMALQRPGDGERFALSLYLLHGALTRWWDEAWPWPGQQGKGVRSRLFRQMLQRTVRQAGNVRLEGDVADARGVCLQLVEKISGHARALSLPTDIVAELKQQLERMPVEEESSRSWQPAGAPEPAGASARAVSAVPPSPDELILDPANERATRQSLLRVAALLTGTEPENPLGYRIRRYAIWYGISALPPTRDGKRTDLAAVSADRVAEYQEALERGPDPGLWQRIEQSLSRSPFWLDGHWLSARTASALGHTDCADVIRSSLGEFVQRLPGIETLTFSNGTPFLSEPAAAWLQNDPADTEVRGTGASPWEQALIRAREQASLEGLGPALLGLEAGLAAAREPRDRFYWRLACARLLQENGLPVLARQHMEDLYRQLEGLELERWEPGLLQRLQQLAR